MYITVQSTSAGLILAKYHRTHKKECDSCTDSTNFDIINTKHLQGPKISNTLGSSLISFAKLHSTLIPNLGLH